MGNNSKKRSKLDRKSKAIEQKIKINLVFYKIQLQWQEKSHRQTRQKQNYLNINYADGVGQKFIVMEIMAFWFNIIFLLKKCYQWVISFVRYAWEKDFGY